MKAIILAAGMGRRLGVACPKCMLDVGGRSIIHRQLAAFRDVGVDAFAVVVGYERERIIEHLTGQPGRFEFIVNERFAETNTLYSLRLAEKHMKEEVFLANADVVFDRRLLDSLNQGDTSRLAIDCRPVGAEEVKVIMEDSRIVRIGKEVPTEEAAGEFLGVARFTREVAKALRPELRQLIDELDLVNDYFELALARLCGEHELTGVDVSDLPCGEVDFPVDLEKARGEIAPRLLD